MKGSVVGTVEGTVVGSYVGSYVVSGTSSVVLSRAGPFGSGPEFPRIHFHQKSRKFTGGGESLIVWPNPVPEKAEIPTYHFILYILRNVFKVSVGNSDESYLLLL